MRMLSRRLQILLDERQYDRLASYAKERNLSVGAAVRQALDSAIPASRDERQRAARRVLTASPMPVPGPDELRAELDEARAPTA